MSFTEGLIFHNIDEAPAAPTLTSGQQAVGITIKDLYRTPKWLLDRVRKLHPEGIFLDPCGNPDNSTGAKHFLHPDMDPALLHPIAWPKASNDQVVFQNHPYSINDVWARYALDYIEDWNPSSPGQYVILANASMGTEWAASLDEYADAWCDLHKRVAFLDGFAPHEPKKGNQWGTRIWYFGNKADLFQTIFQDVGTVAERRQFSKEVSYVLADGLAKRLQQAEPDVLRVMMAVLDRLERGRKAYGTLQLALDKRDWNEELEAEVLDMFAYAAMRDLKRQAT